MDALTMILTAAEKDCPDIKVMYALWLGDLDIEVMDKRTKETHSRIFPCVDVNVLNWMKSLQGDM